MSALKAWISRRISRLVTSPRLRERSRAAQARRRLAAGAEAVLHYFHQVDDPYSQLVVQWLPALRARYRVNLQCHSVPAPDQAAAPDLARLQAWSRHDAACLADVHGLRPLAEGPAECPAECPAEWPEGFSGSPQALAEGAALRARLGHYLGATFHFEGEWYWGVDRLHYLEARLKAAGLAIDPAAPLLAPPPALQWVRPPPAGHRPQLHFYLSLRSPYTHLAAAQVRRLAAHYGADLHLRFVLPMVMRGLAVPRAKRLYIVRDAKREAERLNLPFGCIVDPVGKPTERGLALLHHAIAKGCGPALAESFLQGVFADGIDAGSTDGIVQIARRAGLTADDVRASLADSGWRAVAESNRAELLGAGLWGVPSFRVDDRPAVWGQDRLWVVEHDLLAALQQAPGQRPRLEERHP